MKIAKKYLQNLIKEETRNLLKEGKAIKPDAENALALVGRILTACQQKFAANKRIKGYDMAAQLLVKAKGQLEGAVEQLGYAEDVISPADREATRAATAAVIAKIKAQEADEDEDDDGEIGDD